MKTSVIISTNNRRRGVLRLLENLTVQSVIPDQVVLIEAGNLDWNAVKVPPLLQKRFYPIWAHKCSLTEARAMGSNMAKGRVLFFFDDDIILPPTYIEDASNYLVENAEVIAVGGRYSDLGTDKKRKINILMGRLLGIHANGDRNRLLVSGWADGVREEFTKVITDAEWLFGCNFVVRAKAFAKVQFETNMLAWSFLEDIFFGIRLKAAFGDCMRVLPSLQVIHDPLTSSGIINKFTLRMRILYRFILWRKHILPNNTKLVIMNFILGMIANLLLMVKQEKRFWVISESFYTMFFIIRYPHMSWKEANEFISAKN